MKKLLLLASVAALGASSMSAQLTPSKDPASYENKNGYTFTNNWLISRMVSNPDAVAASFLGANTSRTATIYNDEVLVAQSANAAGEACILRFDLLTGESKPALNLTLNGTPLTGTLCANNIGVDDFGHVYICGFVSDLNKANLKPYLVNMENGELTALPEISPLEWGESVSASAVRVDYVNVIGDLTGAECAGTLMAACNTDNLAVLRAVREQGSDAFEPGFDGFFFWESSNVSETCPMVADADAGTAAPQTSWGTAPMVQMINDEEHIGESFYVDGFTTCPAIYNTQGTLTDSFNSCVGLSPVPGTNGVSEFTLGDNNFVVWSVCQYDKTPGCTASVGTFGDGFDFADLDLLYTFPAEGLGKTSDTGTRAHCLVSKKVYDAAGKEAVYILDFKCMNGIGVYTMAEEGFQAGVDGIAEDVDANAPAVYFNLQGQKVENPAAGLYIVKRGNKVAKELVK